MLAASTLITMGLAGTFLLPLLPEQQQTSKQTGASKPAHPVPLSYREFYHSVNNSQDDADELEDSGHRKAPLAWNTLLDETTEVATGELAEEVKDELSSVVTGRSVSTPSGDTVQEKSAVGSTNGFARVYPPESKQPIGLPADDIDPDYVNPANMASGSVYAPITVNVDGAAIARELASQFDQFEQRMEQVIRSGRDSNRDVQAARSERRPRKNRQPRTSESELASLRQDVMELSAAVELLRADTRSRLEQLAVRSEWNDAQNPGVARVAEAPRVTTRDYQPAQPETSIDSPAPETVETESIDVFIRQPEPEEPELAGSLETPLPFPQEPVTQPVSPSSNEEALPDTDQPAPVPQLPVFDDADLPEELSTPVREDKLDSGVDPAEETSESELGEDKEDSSVFTPPTADELSSLDLNNQPLKRTDTKPITAGNAAPVVFQHVHRFPAGEIMEMPMTAHQKNFTHTAQETQVCPVCGKTHPAGRPHQSVKQVSHRVSAPESGHSGLMVPGGPYRPPRVVDAARGRNRHIHRTIRKNHPEREQRPSMLHRIGATLQNWSSPVIE